MSSMNNFVEQYLQHTPYLTVNSRLSTGETNRVPVCIWYRRPADETKQTCVFTANSSYKEVCRFYVCLHFCHTRVICVHSILNTFTHWVNSCV